MTRALRRLAVCLAFSTCCFLVSWASLATGATVYLARWNPLFTVVIPVLCAQGVLTLGMFGAWQLCRRWGWNRTTTAHVLFLAVCAALLGVALFAWLRALRSVSGWLRNPWAWPVAILLGIGLAIGALRNARAASRFLRTALLTAAPVLAIVMINGCVAALRYSGSVYTDGPLAPALPGTPRIRVVWVIFDELSQAIAFEKRPADLRLPNLDRLQAESFYAVAASSPSDETIVSMPALILGEELAESRPQGPDNLLVRAAGRASFFPWASVPNVFDTARELGFNTAVAGWYHPYGRVLNRSLTQCYWVAMIRSVGMEEPFDTGPAANLPLIRYLRPEFPGAIRLRERAERFDSLMEHARAFAADPSIGLALLHLSVPHPPAFYSRSTGRFSTRQGLSYLDNAALADRALGAVRQAIEQAGLGDRTALLISADHGWRTGMWRRSPHWTAEEQALSHYDTSGVPFLLKLPGQTSALRYDKPFNTAITRQVLTRILSGQLTAAEQLPNLIECLAGEDRKD